MARLIRMDSSGHSTLAEWADGSVGEFEAATAQFEAALEDGYVGVAERDGAMTQVRELPRDADLVIMRRPIAGG
jgi:hypothetical protein